MHFGALVQERLAMIARELVHVEEVEALKWQFRLYNSSTLLSTVASDQLGINARKHHCAILRAL